MRDSYKLLPCRAAFAFLGSIVVLLSVTQIVFAERPLGQSSTENGAYFTVVVDESYAPGFSTSMRGTKGELASVLPFDTCHNMLTLCEQWTSGGYYDKAYDTIRFYITHCYMNAIPGSTFSALGGCAGGATALSTATGRIGYKVWLLDTVLHLRNDNPWFCLAVRALATAYDNDGSNDPAALAIYKFIIDNPRCASSRSYFGDDYAHIRQQQIHLWQDTAKNNDLKNFDSTLPSMHDLGLDTLLSMASVQRYDAQGPTILEDVRLLENPTVGQTSLRIRIGREAYLHIEVLDLLGRKLDGVAASGVFEPGTRTVPLNLFGLASGTYYVRIYTANNEVRTLKLLKSK